MSALEKLRELNKLHNSFMHVFFAMELYENKRLEIKEFKTAVFSNLSIFNKEAQKAINSLKTSENDDLINMFYKRWVNMNWPQRRSILGLQF